VTAPREIRSRGCRDRLRGARCPGGGEVPSTGPSSTPCAVASLGATMAQSQEKDSSSENMREGKRACCLIRQRSAVSGGAAPGVRTVGRYLIWQSPEAFRRFVACDSAALDGGGCRCCVCAEGRAAIPDGPPVRIGDDPAGSTGWSRRASLATSTTLSPVCICDRRRWSSVGPSPVTLTLLSALSRATKQLLQPDAATREEETVTRASVPRLPWQSTRRSCASEKELTREFLLRSARSADCPREDEARTRE